MSLPFVLWLSSHEVPIACGVLIGSSQQATGMPTGIANSTSLDRVQNHTYKWRRRRFEHRTPKACLARHMRQLTLRAGVTRNP